ncbi:hypothetical protein PL373_13720 [Tenacibaculum maritimum]|nr:hypothetical protein [Tenacibaculum maritimum]
MGFLKRLIGNEPTSSELLGKYNRKNIMEKVESFDTEIYLHNYSTNAIRIEIISVENKIFSFFGQLGNKKIEKMIFELQSYPEIGETKQVYRLAHFKSKTSNITLMIHNNSASLILSASNIIGFFNK